MGYLRGYRSAEDEIEGMKITLKEVERLNLNKCGCSLTNGEKPCIYHREKKRRERSRLKVAQ